MECFVYKIQIIRSKRNL